MSVDLHASKIRFVGGFVLFVVGLLIVVFLVPGISKKHLSDSILQTNAMSLMQRQEQELSEVRVEVNRIRTSQRLLDGFMRNIPMGDAQKLHWELSNKLFELSSRYGVRILNVKYAPASRLAVIGDTLESLNVDFDINGIYTNLKSFMLALEKSNHNFVVVEARLEESAEGGHLVVKLFTFWRSVPMIVTSAVPKL